jgi:hypothetical protein
LQIFFFRVVAVESAGRQIPIAFLERVKEDFNKRYGGRNQDMLYEFSVRVAMGIWVSIATILLSIPIFFTGSL